MLGAVNEDTIGVVGILGTTFTGELEPIAEICAARYPDMADAPARLVQGAPAADKAFLDQVLKSAAYQSALTKARIDVAQLPEEKTRVG